MSTAGEYSWGKQEMDKGTPGYTIPARFFFCINFSWCPEPWLQKSYGTKYPVVYSLRCAEPHISYDILKRLGKTHRMVRGINRIKQSTGRVLLPLKMWVSLSLPTTVSFPLLLLICTRPAPEVWLPASRHTLNMYIYLSGPWPTVLSKLYEEGERRKRRVTGYRS